MTEPSFSWLYGTSQGWECLVCGTGVRILDNIDARAEHTRYDCDGAAKSTALVVTR